MKALIDADVIRYSVGFAAEEDPIEYCLHSVKKMIESIVENTGADSYVCYFTGTGNYRVEAATIRPYKGNRPNKKPSHYEAITTYILNHHNGEVVNGMEADDKLAIEHTKAPASSIICTIDKDLDGVAGVHYNWKHNKLYYVSELDAMKWFYTQLLTGDTTDNIQGVPGIGKQKATTLITMAGDIEEDIYWDVLCAYSKKYERPMEALLENAKLLYMLREEDKHWEPPA
jgi:hypothetical protein